MISLSINDVNPTGRLETSENMQRCSNVKVLSMSRLFASDTRHILVILICHGIINRSYELICKEKLQYMQRIL